MAVLVERVGKRIHAEIPYDNGAGAIEAKAVPGARPKFDGRKFVCWTYPLDISVCRDLRRQFGDRLRVGVELAEWARVQIEMEKQQVELRMSKDAKLLRVPSIAPALAEAMSNRTYQRVGSRFIADGRSVLLADEPGLGKTLEGLGGIIEAGCKFVLVFAKKKAVETVWSPEIKRWLGDAGRVFVAQGSKAQREKAIREYIEFANQPFDGERPIAFLVCNIEMVRWTGIKEDEDGNKNPTPAFPDLFRPEWHAIIVDESHKALIGRHTMSKSITQTRYGMMKLRLAEWGIKIAMSGTPYRGKLENMWGTLNWLRPDIFTGYTRFLKTFFDVEDGQFGGIEIGPMRPEKVGDFDKMMAPIMIRRTKGEVAPEMPARQYGGSPLDSESPESTIGVWMEMTSRQKRAYADIVADGEVLLEGGMLTVNGVLAELTRRKQFAICDWRAEVKEFYVQSKLPNGKGYFEHKTVLTPIKGSSPKYDWIKEKIEELNGASKLVVASQFTSVIEAFAEWLKEDGIESMMLTGNTTSKQGLERVRAFNDPANEVPVFLINTMAGGESINLDACADDIVFIDETFIPDDQEQVENRIHRMSRIHHVTVWYLRTLDSVEEGICRITGAREALTKGRLDGSRGVIFKRLLKEDF
jgi:SNF2 family DNA or RNA helicase